MKKIIDNLFPIVFRADDAGFSWVWKENRLHDYFEKHRPTQMYNGKQEKVSYYTYDLHLLSPTRVKFVARDMQSTVSGGIGKVIFEVECDVDAQHTKPIVYEELQRLAKRERKRQLEEMERRHVALIEQSLKASYRKHRRSLAKIDKAKRLPDVDANV